MELFVKEPELPTSNHKGKNSKESRGSLQLFDSLRTSYEHYRIFRIPDILYRHKQDADLAYRPNGFSIGPFHHDKPYAEVTLEIKDKYLDVVVNRFGSRDETLGKLHNAVKEVSERARLCYAEQVKIDREKFVEMLVRDSCFMIELFSRYYKFPSNTNYTLPSTLMFQFTYHDLILLENQVPWFVLKKVFDLVGHTTVQPPVPLHFLAINFFKKIFSHEELVSEQSVMDDQDIDHVLDLLRRRMFVSYYAKTKQSTFFTMIKGWVPVWCSKPTERKEDEMGDIEMPLRAKYISLGGNVPHVQSQLQIPSASRLKEAGVKFRRSRSKPMLYVGFRKGVLELPQLLIDDNTEALFRNLIAFEQCRWKLPPVVTAFAKLMDGLIDTVEDVHILRKHDIICNSLDPEDAVHIFNRLCCNTYINQSYYGDIYAEVNGYCRQWWPRWRAFYLHNYFGKPWAVISQIFALIILTLTILQVVLK